MNTFGGGKEPGSPTVFAISAGAPATTTATITWTTDMVSDSQVDYGTTAAYGSSSSLDASLVTSHSVGLSSLTGNTLYHYRVRSMAQSGTHITISSDNTFTTAP